MDDEIWGGLRDGLPSGGPIGPRGLAAKADGYHVPKGPVEVVPVGSVLDRGGRYGVDHIVSVILTEAGLEIAVGHEESERLWVVVGNCLTCSLRSLMRVFGPHLYGDVVLFGSEFEFMDMGPA